MNAENQDGMKKLLQQSLPRVDDNAEPSRDLWPAVLTRLDQRMALPWFDWALVAGLVGLTAAFPASIPVLLYYL